MKNNKALAFLTLVFVGLFSYWTFEQIQFYRNKEINKSFENLPDTSSSSTENLDNQTIADSSVQKPEEVSDSSTSTSTPWIANDYAKGDITGKTYTVKSGDTLWEIAEGVYGNGSLWVNILQANSNNVGFLPNGQQALIFPGQVLQIP